MADNDTPTPDDPDGAKPDLGDAGKKALDAERKARRDAEKLLADTQAKLKEVTDRDKTDGERLAEKVAAAEQRASDAEAKVLRLEVATAKGLTAAQARRLVGATQEELEADADDLLDSFKPADDKPVDRPDQRRPREQLRRDGDAGGPVEETDPIKLAASIRGGL